MFSRSTIRVLYVDGRSAAAETVPNRLRREDDRFAVHAVPTPSAALEYLADNDVDCLVSEYELPECDGLDLLTLARDGAGVALASRSHSRSCCESAGYTSIRRRRRST